MARLLIACHPSVTCGTVPWGPGHESEIHSEVEQTLKELCVEKRQAEVQVVLLLGRDQSAARSGCMHHSSR